MAAVPAGQAHDDAVIRLLTCYDAKDLVTAAVSAGTPEGAARKGALYRLHPDGQLRIEAAEGFRKPDLAPYRSIAADAGLPVAVAVRERRPVYAVAGDFPRTATDPGTRPVDTAGTPRTVDAAGGFVCLPLTADGDVLGALALLLPPGAPLGPGFRQRLTAIATACAHRWAWLLDRAGAAPYVSTAYETSARAEHPYPEHAPYPRPPGAEETAVPLTSATGRDRTEMVERAMSNASIGSFDWDFVTGRVTWDERACELFGIKPADFDGRIESFYRTVHPEDRGLVDAAVEESRTTGRYHVVYRIVHPDHTVRWIDAESRVVYDAHGEPHGMVGVVQDRTEELERESAREARQQFVLRLTHGLSAAVSPDEIVAVLARTALPTLGAASVAVYLRDGGRRRLVGSHGFDERGRERLAMAEHVVDRHPRFQALREGHPLFFENRRAYIEAMPKDLPEPGPEEQAAVLLPLTSTDGFVGTCVLVYDRPHTFSPEDRTILTAAGGILGQSFARARLYDTQRHYLTDLQHLMLPRRLPQAPGLDIEVRYEPGSAGLQVGGDWYDVLPRPDGRVALVIGDVQGHSARAAGVMGQLRTAMHTYAAEGHGPVTLMQRGNQALRELDTELFATCCVAEVDPYDGRVRIVRAGHPYPMLLEADGRPRELDVPGGMPLGTFPEDAYPVTVVTLTPGATLLLYTDGLIEQRDVDYGTAVGELSRLLSRWAGPKTQGVPEDSDEPGTPLSLGQIADRITAPAISRGRHDDIAVLLVRRTPEGAPG